METLWLSLRLTLIKVPEDRLEGLEVCWALKVLLKAPVALLEVVLISHSSERGALFHFQKSSWAVVSLSLAFPHRYSYAPISLFLSIFNRFFPRHLSPAVCLSVRLSVRLSVFYSFYEYFHVILHHSWCIFPSFYVIYFIALPPLYISHFSSK